MTKWDHDAESACSATDPVGNTSAQSSRDPTHLQVDWNTQRIVGGNELETRSTISRDRKMLVTGALTPCLILRHY